MLSQLIRFRNLTGAGHPIAELAFRTGAGGPRIGFGIMTMHRLAERQRQLDPGLTMTLPFMFG
jgi:hypothetical protein